MQAAQLTRHGTPGSFEVREVPLRAPAPDEVVVRVRACGLNHLDLWLEEGQLPVPIELPRTPGSEIAGEIETLGADVDDWRAGQRVAIQSNLFCGSCEYCIRGDESICLNGKLLGVDLDGGFAEKVIVPARALVPLPPDVPFETSAALTLAGSTAMHMLTSRTRVQEGEWVLVIGGASGVGSAAIQIAKDLGGKVISTGTTAEKRAFAARLGADHVVDPTVESWPGEVRKITGKRGVDLVVEHVGGKILEQVFNCLARGGRVVTCGATAGRDAHLNLWPFFVKQHELIGSYGRNRSDIRATLDWAAQGRLRPVIHSIYPLERTSEAFAALRGRSVLGKAVIRP